ncbi:MAG: MoaD/ThiS family protein [Planctomycetaceae bacterium]|nr:MoaD/ThiS family protein [Planctomycetaceae bacterium]
MPRVFIPSSLRRHTGGVTSLDLEGTTIRELVDRLEERLPGLKDRLCEGNRLKPGLAVAVDSRISDLGLMQSVGPNSEVHFVASVGGGC